MNLSTPINTYPLRLFWGQVKLKLGLIKLRGWKDEPFWKDWFVQTIERHEQQHRFFSEAQAQRLPFLPEEERVDAFVEEIP